MGVVVPVIERVVTALDGVAEDDRRLDIEAEAIFEPRTCCSHWCRAATSGILLIISNSSAGEGDPEVAYRPLLCHKRTTNYLVTIRADSYWLNAAKESFHGPGQAHQNPGGPNVARGLSSSEESQLLRTLSGLLLLT